MHFMPKPTGADTDAELQPDDELQTKQEELRNRQAAASCLEAAALTADRARRKSLRRRAAELLLPRVTDPTSP
jgi:hypothetical protein